MAVNFAGNRPILVIGAGGEGGGGGGPDETKADKVAGAVEGNLAGLDAEGNLTDSGVSASELTGAAEDITFDPSGTNLVATDVQAAVEELSGTVDALVVDVANERGIVSYTTASLADGSEESNSTVALGLSFTIFKVSTSAAARVRIYATAADRAADLSRTEDVEASPGAGVLLEVITTAGQLALNLGPMVSGANLESSVTEDIPIAVKNKSGSTTAITVNFTRAMIER